MLVFSSVEVTCSPSNRRRSARHRWFEAHDSTKRIEWSGGGSLDAFTERILGAAFEVHTRLGAGLLESAYEACLAHELRKRGFNVERQKHLPVRYDEVLVDAGYRIDLLVDGQIIIEVKSVQKLAPIDLAQVLTYLKLADLHIGLLLNFNVVHLRDGGIRRVMYGGPKTRSGCC